MSNELQRLLELACTEPAYGPTFYRCLLESEVYALVPAPIHRPDDRVRFIMWKGADGIQVLPYFASREQIGRVLTAGTEAFKIRGRLLLERTRGATLVLNPNEPYDCRLSAGEIDALLRTGAVSAPESYRVEQETTVAFDTPKCMPQALIHSLIVLYAQHPSVLRAYLVTFWPIDDPEKQTYLIGLRLSDDAFAEQIVRESSAVMQDVPPDLPTDVVTFSADDDSTLQGMAKVSAPFYECELGRKLVMPSSSRIT